MAGVCNALQFYPGIFLPSISLLCKEFWPKILSATLSPPGLSMSDTGS